MKIFTSFFLYLIVVFNIAHAACPINAEELKPSLVTNTFNEYLPKDIKEEMTKVDIDEQIAYYQALKSQSEESVEQNKNMPKQSYGGSGDPLSWPNGCSIPTDGLYCNSLFLYHLYKDSVKFYDFKIKAAECYKNLK